MSGESAVILINVLKLPNIACTELRLKSYQYANTLYNHSVF